MLLQVTLTVSEAKRIIALATLELPQVKRALKQGKILIKGGTTTSLLVEKIAGSKLAICGRISPRGAKGPLYPELDYPHSIIIENNKVTNVDDVFEKGVEGLDKEDVFIVGANAIDSEGGAAMMAGSTLGGDPGRILGAVGAEGFHVLILAGLEKLIPGRIKDAVMACGRKKIDLSFGMAVGLIPISGKLITEQTALELLADVRCTVIGKGGVSGAEGSTTMVVEGKKEAVKVIFDHVQEVKRLDSEEDKEELDECEPGCEGCAEDLGCIYGKKRHFF